MTVELSKDATAEHFDLLQIGESSYPTDQNTGRNKIASEFCNITTFDDMIDILHI